MSIVTDDEFENIKSQYNKNNFKIGVELSEGRKFLIDIVKDAVCLVWGASFTLIMILSFFVAIYALGFIGGILYAIAFCLLYSVYMGICSLNAQIKQIIYYIAIGFMFVSLTFEWKLTVLSFFTCLSIMWSYLFYNYILQKVVHEALRDKRIFEFLLENNIIILKGE